MIGRAFDDVTYDDISALVDNKVAEGRDIEFKLKLPGGSDQDIKELAADVSSLANAYGGDIVFGIEEKAGCAVAVRGIETDDADREILRLESIIRDGLEPRLAGLRIAWVAPDGKPGVILIRVPASLSAPHRVIARNSGRFFSRNSRGKYEMDTHDLRMAFTANEQMPAKFRKLHLEAVHHAGDHGMPFALQKGAHAVAVLAPLSYFREARSVAVTKSNALVPIGSTEGYSGLPTIDGILMHSPQNDAGKVRSYAITHWTGRTEAAWTIGHRAQDAPQPYNGKYLAPPKRFEEGLADFVRASIACLTAHAIDGPWVLTTSVHKLLNYVMPLPGQDFSRAAWQDVTTLPELFIEGADTGRLLPVMQAYWRLFGEERP